VTPERRGRVAILYPGTPELRRNATRENNRFADLFRALVARGLDAEPAVYHDDLCEEVRRQLAGVDAVLVWVNPIEGGRDRSVLDAMLRDVAATGVAISAHPDVILALGTKEVLHRTRDIGWGCDTHIYSSMRQMRNELPARLATGAARVLKRYRGNGGDGVWKVQLPTSGLPNDGQGDPALPTPATVVRVHHAKKGCVEEEMTLGQFLDLCAPYFAADQTMIDQEYQVRLPEGMVRCYLVHDTVAGFGHQAINALCPAPPGAAPAEVPQPGPRLYHPETKPEFQALRQKLETEWVPAVQRLLAIAKARLPVLWDCDFLLGPRDASGDDSYVLCEINVSSVAPYPESAVPHICDATLALVQDARRRGRLPR
jgi:hypothetical protein